MIQGALPLNQGAGEPGVTLPARPANLGWDGFAGQQEVAMIRMRYRVAVGVLVVLVSRYRDSSLPQSA